MADAEHAVIIGKRHQHVEELFRRGVRTQFGTVLGLPGKAQRFFGNIGSLSGPEIGAAKEVSGGDVKPDKAVHGFVVFSRCPPRSRDASDLPFASLSNQRQCRVGIKYNPWSDPREKRILTEDVEGKKTKYVEHSECGSLPPVRSLTWRGCSEIARRPGQDRILSGTTGPRRFGGWRVPAGCRRGSASARSKRL